MSKQICLILVVCSIATHGNANRAFAQGDQSQQTSQAAAKSTVPAELPLARQKVLASHASSQGNTVEHSDGEYTNINGFVTGINLWGQIVGSYCLETPQCTEAYNGSGPFLLSNGTYTTPYFPPVVAEAYPSGINVLGEIVGEYWDKNNGVHGFLVEGTRFITIDAPGASPQPFYGTIANAINAEGDVLGQYYDKNGNGHDFIWKDGHFTDFVLPIVGSTYNVPSGINARGEIVGYYNDASGVSHGYLLCGGVATIIDFPGATSTSALGINLQGDIVGSYSVPVSTNPYVSSYAYGFLLHEGKFATINPPNGSSAFDGANTGAAGINDIGEIVGDYQMPTGTGSAQIIGFLRR